MTNCAVDHQKITLAVTGGNGFIARGVIEHMAVSGVAVRALSRGPRPNWVPLTTEWRTVVSYGDTADLTEALRDVRYVLHLADNPDRTQERTGAEALRNCCALIYAARANAIEGIVVASSVYARFSDATQQSYGAVKRAIEQEFLDARDLRTIVLRLPPVYGPGGKGGLATLSRLVKRGLPLPLGAAQESRAYLSRHNFTSLIFAIVNAGNTNWSAAAGRIFEPSDDQAVATCDLIRMIATQSGRSARLVRVPLSLLRSLAAMTGRSEMVTGAVDGLEVASADEIAGYFAWRPEEQMPQSLAFLREG